MLSVYPACFFKEKKGYSVVFPDLNWLATCGKTETEAFSKAVECLASYLYTLSVENEPFPKPSKLEKIKVESVAEKLEANKDGAFVNMVSVDVKAYAKEHFEKSVRKTLTIPIWLNDLALEKHINFSQTLQEALIEKVMA